MGAPAWQWALWGGTRCIARQKADLDAFGVRMDTWFHESDLYSITARILRTQGAMGQVHQDGKNGPICINCASSITPGEPCAFCAGASVASGMGRRQDSALHPDCDRMA